MGLFCPEGLAETEGAIWLIYQQLKHIIGRFMAMMAANDVLEEAGENRWRPTALSLALGDKDSTAHNALKWWCVWTFILFLDHFLWIALSIFWCCLHATTHGVLSPWQEEDEVSKPLEKKTRSRIALDGPVPAGYPPT